MEFFPALIEWAGPIAVWLLVIQLLGLIAWPLVSMAARSLDDRGYFLSKAMALVLLTFLSWAVQYAVGYGLAAIALALTAMAGASALALLQGHASLEVSRRHVLQTEAVFLLVFFAFLFIQMYHPFIEGGPIMTLYTGERFMDSAFMSSILRADSLPPPDPWLAGHRLYNYYYLGYLTGANLSFITTIPVKIVFNLGPPTLAALTAVLAFGILRNMTGRARFGLLAVLFLVFAGNLAIVPTFFDQLLDSPSRTVDLIRTFWDDYYWAPTRALMGGNQAITEFPFFTFMWGSFHPNAIAIPFQALVIALLLAQARSGPLRPGHLLSDAGAAVRVLLLGISLGYLFGNNAWDYPTYVALTAFFLFFFLVHEGERLLPALLVALAPVAVSLIVYAPYILQFDPAATEGFPIGRTEYPAPIKNFVLIFGLFLFATISFLTAVARPWAPPRTAASPRRWEATLLLAAATPTLLAFAANRYPLLLLPFLVAGLGLWALLRVVARGRSAAAGPADGEGSGRRMALLAISLALAGAGVAAFAEVFFIRDYLQGGEFQRMNTVFKFYSQVWVLWSIAAAFGVYWLLRAFTSWLRSRDGPRWPRWSLAAAWSGALVAGILLSLIYPPLAVNSWTRGLRIEPTLDGTEYLKEREPGDYQAVEWLNENIDGQPIIVEAVPDEAPWNEGFDYTYYTRVASLTGLPTIVGWVFHEFSWGMRTDVTEPRIKDVVEIYRTDSPERAAELMRKYGAELLYIGRLEREEYPQRSLAKFDEAPHLFQPIYRQGDVVIYRLLSPGEG